MASEIFHVIKDPVHGTMQFTSQEDAWIKPFIDSTNFQRLRHIKQLGLGDYIFPGAVHTRFNHCLGCCYVGSQISLKIGLNDAERQLVLIACLLHDIGHGPFSHAFEGLYQTGAVRHEDWTPFFLAEYETAAFFKNYNKLNPKLPLDEEKFRIIGDMIMHKPVKRPLLADIVSSQLDADRLDYLLRDSHFCGVRYSEFDLRWMLHCMAIIPTDKGERLGITYKGIGVVEHYLMARRLLMRNICYSQKKLAFEHMLVQLLALLAEHIGHHQAFAKIAHTRIGRFLIAANEYNLQLESAKQLGSLKRKFIENNYQDYRELCDYDVFALIKELASMKEDHPAVQIATRLQNRMMPRIIRLDHADLEQVEQELREFKSKNHKQYQDWQVTLMQNPHRSYSGEDDPILVLDEHDNVKPLNAYSFMINAMSDQMEHVAFLFIDKTIGSDKAINSFVKKLKNAEEVY